ncbi:hypothetical protein ABE10_10600, partial [Bacillus toyonensis]|nr:hypothetical protein [Bacillus toyonensis]
RQRALCPLGHLAGLILERDEPSIRQSIEATKTAVHDLLTVGVDEPVALESFDRAIDRRRSGAGHVSPNVQDQGIPVLSSLSKGEEDLELHRRQRHGSTVQVWAYSQTENMPTLALNRPDFRSVLQARMEHDEQEVLAGDA